MDKTYKFSLEFKGKYNTFYRELSVNGRNVDEAKKRLEANIQGYTIREIIIHEK